MLFFWSVYSAHPMSFKIAKCFMIMVLILLIPQCFQGVFPGPPTGFRPTRARWRAPGPHAFKETLCAPAAPPAPFGIPPGFASPPTFTHQIPPLCIMIQAQGLHGSARLSFFYWSCGETVCMPNMVLLLFSFPLCIR